MFQIKQQTQADSAVVEELMIKAFGPDRYDRSVWALRPGAPVETLCLIGYDDDQPVGSLRFWEVMLGDETILLLGPLAVQPHVSRAGLWPAISYRGYASCAAWRMAVGAGVGRA